MTARAARLARRLFVPALLTFSACISNATPRVPVGAASPPAAGAEPAAIFMYHHVSPTIAPGPYARALTVPPAEFEQQLSWLRSRGCVTTTVEQVVADASKPRRNCEAALTFDDGYDDAVRFALPLLRRYGARATFYITTGYVGQPGHVSRAALARLLQAGMEIGAHSVHHYDLTTLPGAQSVQEIIGSRRSLQSWTGGAVSSFAYPAGRQDAGVVNDVRAAGFANAVTTDPGEVSRADDPFLLPRYRILRGGGLALFAQVLGAAVTSSVKAQAAYDKALHAIARRRIEGNTPQLAESVAVALLARRFAEPIMKVHVLTIPEEAVAGIVLSGVKFHAPVSRNRFIADVREMAKTAFAAAPSLDEIDIWATVPVSVPAGEPVSGDFAVPTSKTVFSSVVTQQRRGLQTSLVWGTTYWDPRWLVRAR